MFKLKFISTRRLSHWILPAILITALLGGGCAMTPTGGGRATNQARQNEADAILERWVEALGGAEKLKSVKTMITDVDVRFSPETPTMKLLAKETGGGRFRWEFITPAFGPIITISDGKHALRKNALLGNGLMDTQEFKLNARDSDPQYPLKIANYFPTRRRLPDVEADGTTLQVLELVDRDGITETWFMDPVSGLRVKYQRGNITSRYSDFRTVDGLTTAFMVETLPAGIKFTINKITFDTPSDPADFHLDKQEVKTAALISKILDRHYEAIGGEAAEQIKTRRSIMTTDIPAQGVKINVEMIQKRPMKLFMEQTIPGMGTFFQGYDGQTGWASNELQGYRELKGQELAQLLSSADLGGDAGLREACPFRQYVGKKKLPGGPAVGIKLAGYSGPNGVYWFNQKNHRLAQVESAIITGPTSYLTMTMEMEDYRQVDDVWLPFLTRIENPSMKLIMTLQSVENNIEVDDTIFTPRTDD